MESSEFDRAIEFFENWIEQVKGEEKMNDYISKSVFIESLEEIGTDVREEVCDYECEWGYSQHVINEALEKTPTIDPETLPIVKELREKLARYEQAEIESRVYKDTGASGPWVTSDGKMFWWNDPEHSDLSNKNPWEVTNEEFEKADSAAYERAIAHEKEFMERKNNELQ